MSPISFNNGKITIVPNADGSFDTTEVLRQVVTAGVAPTLYKISEDVLKEAVGRANIKTGLLRSSGNVILVNDNNPLIEMQLVDGGKVLKNGTVSPGTVRVGRKDATNIVALKALNAMSKSGSNKIAFRIGFHTAYAEYIHEGPWKNLGYRSRQANNAKRRKSDRYGNVTVVPGRYAGKVGKYYLKRAWTDNETRYIVFFKSKVGN